MTIDLREYDAVLLDLDGTIWHEDVALPGAIELIRTLQARGQPFAFVSNSGLSPRQLLGRFGRMGVTVDVGRIYTAAASACDYVRANFPRATRVFNVGGDAYEELLADHVTFVEEDDAAPCEVVMSASLTNRRATIERFQTATRHLVGGSTLVSLCADRLYPTPRGVEIGAGPVAAMLASAANVPTIYSGKPQRVFFETLCTHLGVEATRCVLVGDNLEADVAGARQIGMRSILPLTGITTRAHLERLDASLAPDAIVEDLRHLR